MDQSLLLKEIIDENSKKSYQGDNMATSSLWSSGNLGATLGNSDEMLDASIDYNWDPNFNSVAEKSVDTISEVFEPGGKTVIDSFSTSGCNIDDEGFQVYTNRKNTKRSIGETSPDETLIPNAKRLGSSSIANLVFIKGVKENILSKNPLKLKQALTNIDGSFKGDQIKYAKDSLKIQCNSDEQKTRLLNINMILGIEVVVSEHNALSRASKDYEEYEKVIIFGVSTNIDESDICEETKAISAKRLLSKMIPNTDRTPSENVVLSYYCNPPKVVSIGFKLFKTKIFIPQPLRCWNCQRYGQSQKACNGKTTCPRCAQNHKFEDCKIRVDIVNETTAQIVNSSLRCANCQQAHSAAYRGV